MVKKRTKKDKIEYIMPVTAKKAPRWYVFASFLISVILIFVYFVDYTSASDFVSVIAGIIVLLWFLVNIGYFVLFVTKMYSKKSISIPVLYLVYLGVIFSGKSFRDFVGESVIDFFKLVCVIAILILSLYIIRNKEFD